jgi:hypothetical protein
MEHVSDQLYEILADLRKNRDSEVSMAGEVAVQYLDHYDKPAYREIDRQVAQLARSWDRMIRLVEKTAVAAEKIEASCEGFYGD